MSDFSEFSAWAEANPNHYAYCVDELKAFISRIEQRATWPLFNDLTASRISRAERLAPGDVTELSVDARMAVLLAFAKKHPAPEKHTSGPWQARADNENPFSAWSVYGVSTWGSSEFICQTSGNCTANAKRIVACVNACEGISTQEIDGGWTARKLDAYAKSLEQQIDALKTELAMLKTP